MPFQRKPPTPEVLSRAEKAYPRIRTDLLNGMSVRQAVQKYHITYGALEQAMKNAGDEPAMFHLNPSPSNATEQPPSPSPPTPTETASSAPEAPGKRPVGRPRKTPSDTGAVSPPPPPPSTPSIPPVAPPEPRVVPGLPPEPMQYPGVPSNEGYGPTVGFSPATGPTPPVPPIQGASFGGGEVPSPPVPPPGSQPSPLMSAFEVPDMYLTLYSIMVENGLRPTYANGVIRQFRHFPPDDYKALDKILMMGGTNVQARNSIVNAWKLETREMGGANGSSESPESASSPEEVARRIERITENLTGQSGTPLDEAKQLELESLRLKVEEARLALEKRKKELGLVPSTGEDDYIDVLLNMGGYPVKQRVKREDLPLYQPLIVRPPPDSGVGNPEIAELRKRLEEAEKRAAEERERRLEDTLNSLRAKIEQLQSGPSVPTELQQKLERLEREVQEKERQRLEDQIANLNRRIEEMNRAMSGVGTPEWVLEQKRRLEEQAAKLGMVPASEKGKLDEEQIQLEALRESTKTKNEAQAEAYRIAAEKVRQTGKLKDALIDSGLPKVGIEYAKKVLNASTPPVPGGAILPSPEQLEAELAAAEAHTSDTIPPSPAEPQNPQEPSPPS